MEKKLSTANLPTGITFRNKLLKLLPNALYMGIDIAKPCYSWHQKIGNMYEMHAAMNFSRMLVCIDYGLGDIRRDQTAIGGSLSDSNGHYFKLGLGCNFLSDTPQHNHFFMGITYASSFFNFQLKSTKLACQHEHDTTKNDMACKASCKEAPMLLRDLSDDGVAHWWEFMLGGKVFVLPIVSIGCTVRYKFDKTLRHNFNFLPFDIPGWGLGEDNHAFGYNLYILIRIPFQKKQTKSNE